MREAKRYENFIGGAEGTEFEWDIFGAVDTKNPEYQKELKKVVKPNGFVFFRDALKLVKKFQPGDPRNPERAFARDLRIEIIDQLGLTEEKDMDRIKFYTAIGTPLDKWHSIDGFFEIDMRFAHRGHTRTERGHTQKYIEIPEREQRNGAPIIITLEASTITQEQKRERGQEIKADIFITDKEIGLENEEELGEKIKSVAKEIVNIFKAKEEQISKKGALEGKYNLPGQTL